MNFGFISPSKTIDLSSFKMTIFYHDQASNPCKICKFLTSVLKDAFFNCHTFKRSLLFAIRDEEEDSDSSTIFFNDEQEVVLKSKARAMEAKLRRKSIQWDESFSSVFYPVTLSELFIKTGKPEETKKGKGEMKQIEDQYKNEDVNKEEILSVASQYFSCCSCAASVASEFFSVNTSFSHCLSFKEFENEIFPELKRRAMFHEFSHCEGWPFGLCKRAMLLPPLPKSPSDSWSWCKSGKIRQDKLMA